MDARCPGGRTPGPRAKAMAWPIPLTADPGPRLQGESKATGKHFVSGDLASGPLPSRSVKAVKGVVQNMTKHSSFKALVSAALLGCGAMAAQASMVGSVTYGVDAQNAAEATGY